MIRLRRMTGDDMGWIAMVLVDEPARHWGIGTRLVRHALFAWPVLPVGHTCRRRDGAWARAAVPRCPSLLPVSALNV